MQELTYHIEFLTATIYKWKHLLADDRHKQIIIDTLEWLSAQNKCKVHAFVIMPNHMHILWKIADGYLRREVQGALLSYTAHEFQKSIRKQQKSHLKQYHVDEADRVYQFWERDPMVKECFSEPYLIQKLNYIHNNPFQPHWQIAQSYTDYKYSSASFYESGKTDFTWLVHIRD